MLSLTTRMRIYLIYFFFSALCIDEKKVPSDQLHTPSTLATLFFSPLSFVCVCVFPLCLLLFQWAELGRKKPAMMMS
jgi:hypothetical protein